MLAIGSAQRFYSLPLNSSCRGRLPVLRHFHSTPIACSHETHEGANDASGTPRQKNTVTEFKQLNGTLKRFAMKVHPDLMAGYPEECIDENEKSLATVFRLFDGLRMRCNDGLSDSSPIPSGSLASRTQVMFWYKKEGEDLKRCPAVDISVSPIFEEKMNLLTSRQLKEQSRAHWLHLSHKILTSLCESVEIPPPLDLDETVLAIVSRNKRPNTVTETPKDVFGDPESMLRKNLLKASPLAQGKGVYSMSEWIQENSDLFALNYDASSAFTTKERTRRVDEVLGDDKRICIAKTCAMKVGRRSLLRLRTFLIAYHDQFALYHPVWNRINLTMANPSLPNFDGSAQAVEAIEAMEAQRGVSQRGFFYSAPNLSITIPADFTAQALALFLNKALVPMIQSVSKQVEQKSAKAEAARHKTQ